MLIILRVAGSGGHLKNYVAVNFSANGSTTMEFGLTGNSANDECGDNSFVLIFNI